MFLRQVIRGMWYTMLLVDFFCSFFTYACIYFLSKKHIMTRFQLVIRRNQKNRHRQKRVYMLNGCPQKKATCFKVGFLAPKKPNSANRKVVRVVFSKARRRAFCYIPGIKHNLQKFFQQFYYEEDEPKIYRVFGIRQHEVCMILKMCRIDLRLGQNMEFKN